MRARKQTKTRPLNGRRVGTCLGWLLLVGCGVDVEPPGTVEPTQVYIDDGATLACVPTEGVTPPGELPTVFTACGVKMEAWAPPVIGATPRVEFDPVGRWSAPITGDYAIASDMARVYVIERATGERLTTAHPPGVPTRVVAGGGNAVVELPSSFWLATLDGDALIGQAIYVVAEDQSAELAEFWWRGGSQPLAVDESTLAIVVPGGLAWFDIRDPLHPVELACIAQSLDPDEPSTVFVTADTSRAVVSTQVGVDRQISIYNRAALDSPVLITTSTAEVEPPAWVEGDRVLVGGTDQLELYDISGASPRLIDSADYPRMSNNYAPPPVGGFVLFPGPYNDDRNEMTIFAVDLRADALQIWTGSTATDFYECSIILTSPDGTRQVELAQGVPAPDRFEPVVGLQCPAPGIAPGGSALVAPDQTAVVWLREGGYSLATFNVDSPLDSPVQLDDRVEADWGQDPIAWTLAGLLQVHESDGGDWGLPSSGALEFHHLDETDTVRVELPARPMDWDVSASAVWLVTEAAPTYYGEPVPDPPNWILGRVLLAGDVAVEFEEVAHEGDSPPYAVASDSGANVYVLFHDGSVEVRSQDGAVVQRLDRAIEVVTTPSEENLAISWMLASDDGAWVQGVDELVQITPTGEMRRFGACDGARLVDASGGYVYLAVPHTSGGRATHDIATIARATPRQLGDGTWAFDVDGRIAAPHPRRALAARDRGAIATFGDLGAALGATLTVASW